MDHTTTINIFLVVIVVLFIGGLILIGRRGRKVEEPQSEPSKENNRRLF